MQIKDRLICFVTLFILLLSSSFALYNPQALKELKDDFSNEKKDDVLFLKSNQGAPFMVGVPSSPVDLDPVDTWDSYSNDLIEQVCEGLFRYNLSEPNMPRINWLAENYQWEDKVTLQITLREGVLFHDGTPFNATAAKWNLDRLLYLTNCSGTLPITTPIAKTSSLWRFPNGTAIINQVDVINQTSIRIHLNGVYSPLLDLLSYTNAYMLSPTSTPATDYIDLTTGDLVGTGPFVYDGYIPDIEINFHAFENYWQGMANITNMVFSIIFDANTRNNAMLAYDIDFLQGHLDAYVPSFELDPEITVMHYTETYGISSLIYYYLGFNNERINKTWRKAISYAINYSYIVDELQNGEVVRANSPISPGFGDAYNSSTNAATWNLAKARQILIDAGIPGTAGLTANNNTIGPVADAWKAANLASFNYTYNIGNVFREDLLILLQDNLDQIGITLIDAGMTFSEFLDRLFFYHNKLELFWIGWGPDYYDPYNMLYPIFDPISYGNAAQVNDPKLNTMLESALQEIDDVIRDIIYKNIQSYLAIQLYPHAFGYHPKITYVYSANLTKYPHNALNRLYFYPCEWETGEITPSPPPSPIFKVGVRSSPVELDPVNTWDSTSMDVIEQVCEGLFRYNLSDPNLPRINWLAEDYRWIDDVTLLIKLREGVIFHDDTPFDATAAKWNLDRLLYFTNCSGTLPPTTQEALPSELWKFPNDTAIISQVDVVNQTNILIHLNGAYSPLLDLLTFTSAYMLSPSSTPGTDYIDLTTGDLVGTGPFVYDGYTTDIETSFHAFENYWQGKANINEMVFTIIPDSNNRNDAMLAGDIDFLQGHLNTYIPSFEADPNITVMHYTDIYGIPGLVYYFLGFNNSNINATWRKAMSYAINYSYIIDVMQNGEVVRANSPVSPGYGDAYNASTKAATWNLAKARQVLIDAGIPGTAGLIANNDTTGLVADAWKAANLASFNYTYNVDNQFRSDLYIVLADWFDQIGITLVDDGVTWTEFIYRLFVYRNKLQLYWIGWLPDYLDPYNILYYLFDPISYSNTAQVNDPKLNNMLENALQETNDSLRDIIYKNIQSYLATQLYPHAFGYHPKITYVYSANLTNYPHNALQRLYFYPCEWETGEITPPPPPTTAIIFIDDSDPNYNWSKTALENDWCSGSGTWNDPYVIKDLNFDGQYMYTGIEIWNSSVYFRIENCTFNNCLGGIHLTDTNNSLIYNNSFYDTKAIWGTIALQYSHNNSIILNRISNVTSEMGYASGIFNRYGNDCIYDQNVITETYVAIMSGYNSGTMITNNEVSFSLVGVTTGFVTNATIKENHAFNNTYGIVLQFTNDTLVKLNQAFDNDFVGIYIMGGPFGLFYGCHYNTITENQVYDNIQYGLVFSEVTSHNTVYLNMFIGNGMNAQDNGTLNNWDNGAIGNSWDDYVGVDANDDGIGDTPYLIDGSAGSMDNFPIFDDGPDLDITPPIIVINEPDMGDEFTTTAPIYAIEITEPNLDSMWYTVDGGITNNTITSLAGTIDQTVWNNLPYGVVTITFYANDTYGNVGSASVLVYKNAPVAPPGIPGINPIFLIIMISIGIIGLIWQFKQKKFK
ncbi:MAG: ABC transporter substrate-binding protein [Promethearchaeota archaeon]